LEDKSVADQCTDPTQTFTIDIPCVLAERAERYANDNDISISNVVIEALDNFLRKQATE
jgi:hypothetical protein